MRTTNELSKNYLYLSWNMLIMLDYLNYKIIKNLVDLIWYISVIYDKNDTLIIQIISFQYLIIPNY